MAPTWNFPSRISKLIHMVLEYTWKIGYFFTYSIFDTLKNILKSRISFLNLNKGLHNKKKNSKMSNKYVTEYIF